MNARLEHSDAALEQMLLRRARRAEPGNLADLVIESLRRPPARTRWPWDDLVVHPRLASGSARLLWVGIVALLTLTLVGGLLAAGAWRLLDRGYPLLAGNPALGFMSRPASGDELWTADAYALWHYVDDTWGSALTLRDALLPAPFDGEMLTGLALGPDGAPWISGEKTVATLRDGTWTTAWTAPASAEGLRGLAVAQDGTVWVGQGSELVGLRPEAVGYSTHRVRCPHAMSRFAVTTDGIVYGGGFSYSDGYPGLARSDGEACQPVFPLGDGQAHDVADLAAGPDGTLAATLFDAEASGTVDASWVVMLRDGRWATLSGPTIDDPLGFAIAGLAIAPDGHPWRIDDQGRLERYGGNAWRVVAPVARALAMAPDGVLWFMTDRGIERIRTDAFGN